MVSYKIPDGPGSVVKTVSGGRVRFAGFALHQRGCVVEPHTSPREGVLELYWGERKMESHEIRQGDLLAVHHGEEVHPGSALFETRAWCKDRDDTGGLAGLRSILDARPSRRGDVARLSPQAGTVLSIEGPLLVLRTRNGRTLRLRRQKSLRSYYYSVRVGDDVRRGQPLFEGMRSHHQLLRIYGEQRLFEHLLEELEAPVYGKPPAVPRVYWSLVLRALLGWRRVVHPGDSGLRRNAVLARAEFERIERETLARGGVPARGVPVLRGLRSLARRAQPQIRSRPSRLAR